MKLIAKNKPRQMNGVEETFVKGIELVLPSPTITTMLIKIKPVQKLPSWLPSHGKPGTVMLDEIFIY
jgi:hypothetical protein